MNLNLLKDLEPWEWPRDAGPTFLKTLQDSNADPQDRLIAAELAGDSTVISDDLAGALLAVVCDGGEPESLRAKAATALGPALELAADDEIAADLGFDESPISTKIYREIQKSLQNLYLDAGTPKDLRRRILEASVRAPENWHAAAVRSVFASEDEDWKLTAVFCMAWIKGFDTEIVEALESPNPDIHYEAVGAAGNWEVAAAWPHVARLVKSDDIDKPLLIAAIDAVAGIRPAEARDILGHLMDARDEDISDAAYEAILMADGGEIAEHEFDEDAEEDDLDDDNFSDDLEDDEDDEDGAPNKFVN